MPLSSIHKLLRKCNLSASCLKFCINLLFLKLIVSKAASYTEPFQQSSFLGNFLESTIFELILLKLAVTFPENVALTCYLLMLYALFKNVVFIKQFFKHFLTS